MAYAFVPLPLYFTFLRKGEGKGRERKDSGGEMDLDDGCEWVGLIWTGLDK